jgi:hypothetical protein
MRQAARTERLKRGKGLKGRKETRQQASRDEGPADEEMVGELIGERGDLFGEVKEKWQVTLQAICSANEMRAALTGGSGLGATAH